MIMIISETMRRDGNQKNNTEDSMSSFLSIATMLETLLRDPAPIEWKTVNHLLRQLTAVVDDRKTTTTFSSSTTRRDDASSPVLGPYLLNILLSRNPPFNVVDSMLQVFPNSLGSNSVALIAACRIATAQAVMQLKMNQPSSLQTDTSTSTSSATTMTPPPAVKSIFTTSSDSGNVNSTTMTTEESSSPYPWILSKHVSVECAKAMLQAYPKGVLQTSSCLSGLCPLDFFLMAPEMIKQRNFDRNLWTKFKLMLVAADCCDKQREQEESSRCENTQVENIGGGSSGLSPIHVILKRILSRPGCLDNKERAQHILWVLHQLRHSDGWVFQKQSSSSSSPSSVCDGDAFYFHDYYPLHFVLNHKCTSTTQTGLVASRELIKILLAAHPSSARFYCFLNKDKNNTVKKQNQQGRLPIHMAVENGWPCHDLLLSVYPESLDIRDPATGFVPFQAAASSSSSSDNTSTVSGSYFSSLDVTFELFRANPMHVAC